MYSWALVTGDTPQTVDANRLRHALGSYPTGVCLVTTMTGDGKREGMTINSFASVSLTPPLILWSIRDDARSAEAFTASRHFIISVLASDQQELALHFAKPAADKFLKHEGAFTTGIGGCPIPLHSVATYQCSTYSRHQEGDHTIIVGRVEEFSATETSPLIFHKGQLGSIWDLAERLQKPA